jgi:hypothetical protein
MNAPTLSQTGELFFIQSALQPGSNLGFNVDGNSTKPGTPVIPGKWQGGLPNELWQVANNYIVSALSSSSQTLYLAISGERF